MHVCVCLKELPVLPHEGPDCVTCWCSLFRHTSSWLRHTAPFSCFGHPLQITLVPLPALPCIHKPSSISQREVRDPSTPDITLDQGHTITPKYPCSDTVLTDVYSYLFNPMCHAIFFKPHRLQDAPSNPFARHKLKVRPTAQDWGQPTTLSATGQGWGRWYVIGHPPVFPVWPPTLPCNWP